MDQSFFQMLLILNMMDKVKEEDIVIAGQIFDRYDIDGSGDISMEELNTHIESAKRRQDSATSRPVLSKAKTMG